MNSTSIRPAAEASGPPSTTPRGAAQVRFHHSRSPTTAMSCLNFGRGRALRRAGANRRYPDPRVALEPQLLHHSRTRLCRPRKERRHDHESVTHRGSSAGGFDDLLLGLAVNGGPHSGAVRDPYPRPEQPPPAGNRDLGSGPDVERGCARVVSGRFEIAGASPSIESRPASPSARRNLARRRRRADSTYRRWALGVDGVEGERRTARAGESPV